MRIDRVMLAAAVLAALPVAGALAGGSNYVTAAGTLPRFQGKVAEWSVPTPKFARDPAIGPDGNIYITVMQADRIARFDTKSKQFAEWDLPAGARPHGLVVDRAGMVWYTGNGNGTIGRLDPGNGRVTEYKLPSGGDPHTIVAAGDGTLWFSIQRANRIGRLDPGTGAIVEYPVSGGPYGIVLDRAGNPWAAGLSGDKLIRIDAKTGQVSELPMGRGSGPRRLATAPDGRLWVVNYGNNRLVEIDPAAMKILRIFDLPGGRDGGGYAVTVDGAGFVYANEINRDTVIRFDPKSGAMQTIRLPGGNVGIRKMIVDGDGRVWYVGSHNGRLGMIE
jgi:virginiamycin B lyase